MSPHLLDVPARWAECARTSVGDVLLAVVLAVLVLVELAFDDSAQPAWVVLATVLALTAVLWRRAAPSAVAVTVLLASLLLAVTATGPFPPQTPFLANLLVLYTAACALGGRRAVVTGAVTLVLVWTAHVATTDGDPGDFLPPLIWGAPWAAGRLVRRRTLEAAATACAAERRIQEHEEQGREAAARERDRIARELHDVVAHGVSLMVVQAGAERVRLGQQQAPTREVLDQIEQAGRTALGELRTMLEVLRETPPAVEPVGRHPQPTLSDLDALVQRVRAAGVPVQLTCPLPLDVPALVAMSGYRIVQEALTNVVKHTPGHAATVTVHNDAGDLFIDISSALPAVPSQQQGSGRGLVGMAERAALVGGTLTAGSRDGRWCVQARLPTVERTRR